MPDRKIDTAGHQKLILRAHFANLWSFWPFFGCFWLIFVKNCHCEFKFGMKWVLWPPIMHINDVKHNTTSFYLLWYWIRIDLGHFRLILGPKWPKKARWKLNFCLSPVLQATWNMYTSPWLGRNGGNSFVYWVFMTPQTWCLHGWLMVWG